MVLFIGHFTREQFSNGPLQNCRKVGFILQNAPRVKRQQLLYSVQGPIFNTRELKHAGKFFIRIHVVSLNFTRGQFSNGPLRHCSKVVTLITKYTSCEKTTFVIQCPRSLVVLSSRLEN